MVLLLPAATDTINPPAYIGNIRNKPMNIGGSCTINHTHVDTGWFQSKVYRSNIGSGGFWRQDTYALVPYENKSCQYLNNSSKTNSLLLSPWSINERSLHFQHKYRELYWNQTFLSRNMGIKSHSYHMTQRQISVRSDLKNLKDLI